MPDDFDLERELAQYEADNDAFETLASKYWLLHAPHFAPAISGPAFADRPTNPIPAYVPGFIYSGCISAIVGPPKAGKSTFTWSMIAALLESRPFLGAATKLPGPILYVSEQSAFSFDAQLLTMPHNLRDRILRSRRFFLMLPEHHFRIVLNNVETPVSDWKGRLEMWDRALRKTKAQILVIDTFNQYADLGAAGENDNSLIASRILELRQLQRRTPTLAILLLSHTRKSARGHYLNLMDCRGGSAYAGALDHGVTFNKHGDTRARFVHSESRMTEEAKFGVIWNDKKNLSLSACTSIGFRRARKLENDEYISTADMSIRDIAAALDISFRQARKFKTDADDDEDDAPMPKVTHG